MTSSLLEFVKLICLNFNDKSLKEYELSSNTVQKVNVIMSKTIKNTLFERLANSPFSLSIDGSSDAFGSSYLGVFVKFIEEGDEVLRSKLLAIIPIGTCSTGEILHNKLKAHILSDEKIIRNFMGLCTDEGSNMVGPFKGVGARLKTDFPYIVNMKDPSHLYNKIFEKALKAIPTDILTMIDNITSHFNYSSQHGALLREIQEKNNLNKLSVLDFGRTRWLSLRNTVERLLNIWPSLQLYFSEHGTEKQKKFFTLEKECYLKVLYLLSNKLNGFNEYFQTEELYYNEIANKFKEGFVVFCNAVLKNDYQNEDFAKLFSFPFEEKEDKYILEDQHDQSLISKLLSNEEFTQQFLHKYNNLKELLSADDLSVSVRKEISSCAIRFILITLKYMKKKLPFEDELIEQVQVIFLEEFNKNYWLSLGTRFSNILNTDKLKESFVNELDNFQFNFKKYKQIPILSSSPIQMWKSFKKPYPTMYLLAMVLIVLPHSSVCLERMFSQLRDIKTLKRNRLTIENLEACILNFEHFKSDKIHIIDAMKLDYLKNNIMKAKPQVIHSDSLSPDQINQEAHQNTINDKSEQEVDEDDQNSEDEVDFVYDFGEDFDPNNIQAYLGKTQSRVRILTSTKKVKEN